MFTDDKVKNYDILKGKAFELGASLFGVADISGEKPGIRLSEGVLKSVDKAVVLGIALSSLVLDDMQDSPTMLYFRNYRSVNNALDQAALALANFIDSSGFNAIAIPASQVLDWKKQVAHLSHKRMGYLGGLGWIGRNNLLVNEKLGSQFRLVSILTDMPLSTDKPVESGCLECRRCIDSCPAAAIKETPEDFAHLLCFEQLKEFHQKRIVEQFICGLCVKACPGNRIAKAKNNRKSQ